MDNTRGFGPFTQRLWTDNDERKFGLISSSELVVVQRRPVFRDSWVVQADNQWAAPLLRFVYLSAPSFYWAVIDVMWKIGLVEVEEAAVFSWRRNFRPFPWRGVRRG